MSSSIEKETVREWFHIPNPVIVELGAHIGEEYQWLRAWNPSLYVMVEPDPSNFTILQKSCPRCVLIHGAITSKKKKVDFYQAENTASNNWASGSIKKPTGHIEHFPEVKFKSPIEVPGYPLDYVFGREWYNNQGKKIENLHIDLLWCDIQGAERDMIEGGRATLRKTRYMMIEAEPEVELYEGQALKPELIAMLPDWEIIKDFGYNLFMRNTKFA